MEAFFVRLINLLNNIDFSLVNANEEIIKNIEISDIIYDSRKIKKDCVFVCLVGSTVDSHNFIKQAVEGGAAVIVAQREVDSEGLPLIIVEDTRLALAHMSAEFFNHPAREIKTIGLTGTKGKTTTSCMIKSILESAGMNVGLIGTLGVLINDQTIKTNNTTPESYEVQYYLRKMVDSGCDVAVLEVSSLGLKWHRIAGFNFDIAVFTNFSPDHIGKNEHESLEEYKYCKSLLFQNCKDAVINIDDPAYEEIIKNHTCNIETFGFSNDAQLKASNESLIYEPGYLGVHFDTSGLINLSVNVDIPGKFSAYNALAAIAACLSFKVDSKAILNGLNTVKVKGRVELLPVKGNYTLLIDYAHNAMSMENILTTLRQYNPNRLICMFGAGGNRAKSRRYEMGEVCGKLADLSVITADNSRFEDVMDIIEDIKIGISKTDGKSVVIPDRREAIRYCITEAQEHDIIVLAGKGHEDYQEIRGVKHHFDEREIVNEILNSL